MGIVLDASVVVNVLLTQEYSVQAERCLDDWKSSGEVLYAPIHWYAEVVSALRFAVFKRKLSPEDADLLVDILPELGVRVVEPTTALLKSSLRWAERLGKSKAYDAQYTALAEQYVAELWSADQRLVNVLQAQGAVWTHWIGEV
jgi:predicted nucleic acid-binding protein